eukprot:4083633-Amphidinium_carterae.1
MAQEKAVQPTSTTRTSDEPASQAPSSRTSGMNSQKRASACSGEIGFCSRPSQTALSGACTRSAEVSASGTPSYVP